MGLFRLAARQKLQKVETVGKAAPVTFNLKMALERLKSVQVFTLLLKLLRLNAPCKQNAFV